MLHLTISLKGWLNNPADNFGTFVGDDPSCYRILALWAVNRLSKMFTDRICPRGTTRDFSDFETSFRLPLASPGGHLNPNNLLLTWGHLWPWWKITCYYFSRGNLKKDQKWTLGQKMKMPLNQLILCGHSSPGEMDTNWLDMLSGMVIFLFCGPPAKSLLIGWWGQTWCQCSCWGQNWPLDPFRVPWSTWCMFWWPKVANIAKYRDFLCMGRSFIWVAYDILMQWEMIFRYWIHWWLVIGDLETLTCHPYKGFLVFSGRECYMAWFEYGKFHAE